MLLSEWVNHQAFNETQRGEREMYVHDDILQYIRYENIYVRYIDNVFFASLAYNFFLSLVLSMEKSNVANDKSIFKSRNCI